MTKLKEQIAELQEYLISESGTSKFRVKYVAERTGNLDEHLEATEMLNLYPATSQFNYFKRTTFYL